MDPASAFSQNSLSDPRRGGDGAPVAGRGELFPYPGLSGAVAAGDAGKPVDASHAAAAGAAVHPQDHPDLVSAVDCHRRRGGVYPGAEPLCGNRPVSLHRVFAGDADRRHRPADHHLGEGCHALAGGVRHPDGGVSHHLQYHSGTAQRLPRPAELFSPQSRQPLANAGAAAYPLGAALFLRRAAYFQWAVADWRGGGGVCRRDRRDQYRAGLSDPTGRLPAGYPADVCRAAADLSRRYRAVWRDVLGLAPGAQRLA